MVLGSWSWILNSQNYLFLISVVLAINKITNDQAFLGKAAILVNLKWRYRV